MIKVSAMYPYTPEVKFDHDYYRDHHMPLVKRLMGDHLHRYQIDKGVGGGSPGSPPAFVAMAHLYCDSVEAFQAGFAPNEKEILDDVPKYTNAQLLIQFSEVVVE